MTEIPDAVRRAMEAAHVDVAEVERSLESGDWETAAAADVGVVADHVAAGLTEELRAITGDDTIVATFDQTPLWGEAPVQIRYENLLPAADVATYKRVKRATMDIATVAREEMARLVGGSIGDGSRSKKEFVRTRHGLYRVSMSYNSDNSTEQVAHERMGVTGFVHLSEPDEVLAFFREHGLDERFAYERLIRVLQARFRQE